MTTLHKWIILLGCLAVVTGCGRTRPPQGPPVISALPPPSLESIPDRVEAPLPLAIPPDIRQVHVQLLQEAHRHFDRDDYPKTIRELTRLLALRPEESIEVEGRWLLAQAYGQIGEWKAAADHYRILADTRNGQYQMPAKLKYQEIQRLLEQVKRPPLDTKAIRLTLEQLPASRGFDEGIKKMKEDGITTLLIDLGCEGTAFHTQRVSEAPRQLLDLQAMLRSFVERSHRLQLLVYVGVNLRCAGNWHDSPSSQWRDRSYNVATQSFEDNRFFDLFHPDYQQFLDQFLTYLSEERIDGLVFLDDNPFGIYDGMSPSALQGFRKAFGVDFDPVRAFRAGFAPLSSIKSSSESPRSHMNPDEDSVFWRWAGWKARERLTVFEQLIGQLRKDHRTLQCGLELHPHGLTDPVRALVDYAEDAMEATRRSFSFFFVRPEIDRQSAFDQQSVIEKLRRISTKAVLTRLLPVLDDPRRVWVSMPAERGKRIAPGMSETGPSLLQEFPAGIGVVHDLRAFS